MMVLPTEFAPVLVAEGHCLDLLRFMSDQCVQTCVTSPPYYGLRDYGVEPSVWGGNAGCSHAWDAEISGDSRGGSGTPTDKNNRGEGYGRDAGRGRYCSKCGAWLGCLGLEPTLVMYVGHLVEVFREVRRVLRDDGTLWLNLGDSYSGSWGNYGGQNRGAGTQREITTGSQAVQAAYDGKEAWRPPTSNKQEGIKSKDLMGVPWRTALALQDDGWWLRQDIIWSKPNPMTESVQDRCVKAHEYLFLLAKSERYYFDHDAILEPAAYAGVSRGGSTNRYEQNESGADNRTYDVRTRRSVWTISPATYKGAHFAVMPTELVRPCVLAGSASGGLVLDPFGGAGTVGVVAKGEGRRAVLCEINPEYAALSRSRIGRGRAVRLGLLDKRGS